MNYTRFLNSISLARKPSPIRETTKLLTAGSPSLVFLAAGVPNPQMFPFEDMTVSLKNGTSIKLEGKTMTSALQYMPTNGYGPLVERLKQLQLKLHNPPQWSTTDLVVTCGSQDGLCKALEMLVNPNDHVLLEEPAYAGTLAILNPYTPRYLPVSGDASGMIPDDLRQVLSAKWSPKEARSRNDDVPKILYLNPNGANPSGTSLSLERRHEIYSIARDYDLVILEDDPYYFLQFEKERLPSFLSLDVDGRVLRFDSFSKILSSGLRVGFVTGPKALVDRIMLHMQVSVLHATSLSQVITSELLKSWGDDGFFAHIDEVCAFYKQQRDIMVAAAQKHLSGLVEWNVPNAGMFLWIRCKEIRNTQPMIMERALKKDVILLPGQAFMTDPSEPCPYMRASFSMASAADIDRGFRSLAELIREELELQQQLN